MVAAYLTVGKPIYHEAVAKARTRSYPGPVRGEPVAVELLNTVYLAQHEEHDGLASPAALASWLQAVAPGLSMPLSGRELDAIDQTDLDQARDLRGCIRRLADARRHGLRGRRADVAQLNRYARSASRWPELRWVHAPDVVTVASAKPSVVALSDIARDAVRLLAAQDPDSLRSCAAPGCVLYFVRRHPRRTWCSDSCGNRVRAARHYARTRQRP